MTKRLAACMVGSLAVSVAIALAQEGHPLTGTWSGDWGAGAAKRTHITMVIAWDGKTVTGTLNPGPEAIDVKTIALDLTNWTIRFQADGKDASGAAVHVAVEGTLNDLGSYHRTLTGTWQQGTTKGDFKLTRN